MKIGFLILIFFQHILLLWCLLQPLFLWPPFILFPPIRFHPFLLLLQLLLLIPFPLHLSLSHLMSLALLPQVPLHPLLLSQSIFILCRLVLRQVLYDLESILISLLMWNRRMPSKHLVPKVACCHAGRVCCPANNKTWSLVPLPPNRTPIGCKWVFRIMENPDGSINRYKARLVAKGFHQLYRFDYN